MDQIKKSFFERIESSFGCIVDCYCRTNENVSKIRIVYWKCNAVCGRWVIEMLCMKLPNFFFRHEVKGNFFKGDGKKGKQRLNYLPYGRRGYWKRFLTIVNVYFRQSDSRRCFRKARYFCIGAINPFA